MYENFFLIDLCQLVAKVSIFDSSDLATVKLSNLSRQHIYIENLKAFIDLQTGYLCSLHAKQAD